MRLLDKVPESRLQWAEELVEGFEEARLAAAPSPRSWATRPALIAAPVVPTMHRCRGVYAGEDPDNCRRVIHVGGAPLLHQGARCERERALAGSRDLAGTGDRHRSSICQAHLRLALAHEELGQIPARDRALGNASAHAAKFSERHRLLLAVALEADPRRRSQRRRSSSTNCSPGFPTSRRRSYDIRVVRSDLRYFRYFEKLLTIARTGATVLPASPQTRNMYVFAFTEAGRLAERSPNTRSMHGSRPESRVPSTASAASTCRWAKPSRPSSRTSRALAMNPAFRWQRAGLRPRHAGTDDEAIAARPWIRDVHAFLVSRIGRHAEAERLLRAGAGAGADQQEHVHRGRPPAHVGRAVTQRKDYAAVQREIAAVHDPAVRRPPGFARHWSLMAETLAALRRPGRQPRPRRLCRFAGSHVPAVASGRSLSALVPAGRAGARARDATGAATAFSAGEAKDAVSHWTPGCGADEQPDLRDGAARGPRPRRFCCGNQIYRRLLANDQSRNW